MISSTGIYLTIHYCSAEDITGLFLFTTLDEDPCGHHAEEPGLAKNGGGELGTGETRGGATCDGHCCGDHEDHSDFCPPPQEMPGCCSNTILYVAVEDDFVKSDQPDIQITIFEALPFTGQDLIYRDPSSGIDLTGFNTQPPCPLHGKELAVLNRALLL